MEYGIANQRGQGVHQHFPPSLLLTVFVQQPQNHLWRNGAL